MRVRSLFSTAVLGVALAVPAAAPQAAAAPAAAPAGCDATDADIYAPPPGTVQGDPGDLLACRPVKLTNIPATSRCGRGRSGTSPPTPRAPGTW